MQGNSSWTPPGGPLGRLTEAATTRARRLQERLPALRERARERSVVPSLFDALAEGDTVAVIAELKRRSPSKGTINASLLAAERSALYAAAGARALSILTEPAEFGGAASDLSEAASAVQIPILKKDFHVDEAQVWEARALGASALLLIARALPPHRLAALVDLSLELGVEPLVEVRNECELTQALSTPARVIGVNARDLETLEVEPWVTEQLLPSIPSGRLRVAESGLASAADVRRAAALGAHAVLVGSALSAAEDPGATLSAMAAVARVAAPHAA